MHILIVEDHAESASTLERLVRMHGHGSEIAPTMTQALAAASLYHFDVALIDQA
jgi:DNA-binding response OmpR family regulator